ncbi:probable multidrug resistance-associated protein lethal(2)03659 isoform X2 [Agrilus planipennis]|uniref:Probable multidrug resistance-associated protein lethal(2)03659 isoform X2 n=1 Tax=Agrilus planipennis TaxID=224129 RepID=A0A7F5RFL8_AGRPL|nr:probable multidrug resistance-associated protein lethal(2)03659 isoform X2 [Agrilus planipennis]
MDAGLKHKKPPNPRENCNPISAATFMYTIPTFMDGYKRELEVTDLYETFSEHKSSTIGDKLENAWNKEVEKSKIAKRTPSLRRALIRVFGLEFMAYGIILLLTEVFVRIGQPLALGQLIYFYKPGQKEITQAEAYWYAAAVVLCSLINVLVTHPYMQGMLHLGMKMRVASCSLIYRKALRLSKTALGQTTVGQVVNLLSNDVNRFDVAVIFAHQLWVGPLETIIVTYFMYQLVGISAVIGIFFLLMFIPLQFYLGKQTSVLRLKIALRTDERVRLMNEIIQGIQVIKMYTWEKPFAKLVALSRRYEIKAIRATSYIRGIALSFIMFSTRISIFASILAYVLLQTGFAETINAEQVFVLTAFYNILRPSMTVFFPQGIAQVAEANVSVNRLNKFMLYEETIVPAKSPETSGKSDGQLNSSDETNRLTDSLKDDAFRDDIAINVQNASAKWSSTSIENTLTNVNLRVKKGSLVAVIGPVGSGKTSLLHVILKELPVMQGNVDVNGVVSYASQEPWLFAGSVRQNILFGQSLDRERYKTVVRKCALERDFTLLPYADKTIVGERGVSLSGGQRARINLARAVYKDADIYLLDDPLSAVDAHVGKQLFESCIAGYLKEKTVILVTHQLQYLKDADRIVILEDGLLKAEGTYSELQDSGLDFAKLLNDQSDETEIETDKSQPRQRLQSIQSISSNTDDKGPVPMEVEEQKGAGAIGSYVYKAYFKAGGNICVIFNMFMLFFLSQVAASLGDYFITFWVNLEQLQAENGSYASKSPFPGEEIYEIALISNGTSSVMPNATRSSSNFFGSSILDLWQPSQNVCIYIYTGLIVGTVILSLIRSFVFFAVCMRSSTKLHDNMFDSITHATMRFFNTNSSGRILNRFSKDMGQIDELLPGALIDVLQISLALVGIIIVVAIVNPLLMIPTFIIAVIFYLLRIFYLSTSRCVKRLEGITRSPVFAHLNASLQGMTTIRAFGAQKILEKEFDNHQDLHSSAWYIFISTSRAFGLWLDFICVIYIAVVTLSFLVFGDEKFGGNVGLAITQALGLTGMFQWGMRQSTELENQMTSVERVLEYSDVEKERGLETPQEKKPPKNWPERGTITFINLYLRYFPQDPPVLKSLNFTIHDKEKIGIVGRTGAGKSSLIAALFQLTETEGHIYIDNVDIKNLGLHDLRSKISIIPQEPVLFSGTMRKNLDPFDEYDDDTLWKALEEVELKEVVSDLASGLNSKMSEGGTNFSVGQRQLVCLARAIIRNNRILVLDEATANVDPQTDALIQHTIRKKFVDCTVLTIAHRLHTVMDSDKVLVMDAGSMVEFDHPHILLRNTKGFLYSMVQQTGRAMAETLMRIAEQSYNKHIGASSQF